MIKNGGIQIGAKVTLQAKGSEELYEWTLVDKENANPGDGRISVFCPLAQGILGSKAGEEVKVVLSDAVRTYRILKVESPKPAAST